MASIGENIKVLRLSRGWTQEQLAQKLGVSNRSVSRWENGNTMPDLSILPLLGEELGVRVTELLNGERTKNINSAQEVVENIIELSTHEKKIKAKKGKRIFLYWSSLCLSCDLAWAVWYFKFHRRCEGQRVSFGTFHRSWNCV